MASTDSAQAAYAEKLNRIVSTIHRNLDQYGKAGAATSKVVERNAVAIVTEQRACHIIRFDTNGVVIAIGAVA
jgi:hypothetical protein